MSDGRWYVFNRALLAGFLDGSYLPSAMDRDAAVAEAARITRRRCEVVEACMAQALARPHRGWSVLRANGKRPAVAVVYREADADAGA